jgi:hypothetical protein
MLKKITCEPKPWRRLILSSVLLFATSEGVICGMDEAIWPTLIEDKQIKVDFLVGEIMGVASFVAMRRGYSSESILAEKFTGISAEFLPDFESTEELTEQLENILKDLFVGEICYLSFPGGMTEEQRTLYMQCSLEELKAEWYRYLDCDRRAEALLAELLSDSFSPKSAKDQAFDDL